MKTYLACCHFYMGANEESWSLAQQAPESSLKNRLMFHLAHKRHDEEAVMKYHKTLQVAFVLKLPQLHPFFDRVKSWKINSA